MVIFLTPGSLYLLVLFCTGLSFVCELLWAKSLRDRTRRFLSLSALVTSLMAGLVLLLTSKPVNFELYNFLSLGEYNLVLSVSITEVSALVIVFVTASVFFLRVITDAERVPALILLAMVVLVLSGAGDVILVLFACGGLSITGWTLCWTELSPAEGETGSTDFFLLMRLSDFLLVVAGIYWIFLVGQARLTVLSQDIAGRGTFQLNFLLCLWLASVVTRLLGLDMLGKPSRRAGVLSSEIFLTLLIYVISVVFLIERIGFSTAAPFWLGRTAGLLSLGTAFYYVLNFFSGNSSSPDFIDLLQGWGWLLLGLAVVGPAELPVLFLLGHLGGIILIYIAGFPSGAKLNLENTEFGPSFRGPRSRRYLYMKLALLDLAGVPPTAGFWANLVVLITAFKSNTWLELPFVAVLYLIFFLIGARTLRGIFNSTSKASSKQAKVKPRKPWEQLSLLALVVFVIFGGMIVVGWVKPSIFTHEVRGLIVPVALYLLVLGLASVLAEWGGAELRKKVGGYKKLLRQEDQGLSQFFLRNFKVLIVGHVSYLGSWLEETGFPGVKFVTRSLVGFFGTLLRLFHTGGSGRYLRYTVLLFSMFLALVYFLGR